MSVKYGPYKGLMSNFLSGQQKTDENIYRAFNKAAVWHDPNAGTGDPQPLDALKEKFENHWLDALLPHSKYEMMFYRWWRKQQAIYMCDICKISPDYQWCELCQVFPERLARAGCEVCLENVIGGTPKPPTLNLYVDKRGYIQGLLCNNCQSRVMLFILEADFLQETARFIERSKGWPVPPPPEEDVFITVKSAEVLVDGKTFRRRKQNEVA